MLEEYKSYNIDKGGAGQFLQGDRYLTLRELRAKLGGRSRSAIYTDLEAGRLPKPLKLGGRLYCSEGDLDNHLRNLRSEV